MLVQYIYNPFVPIKTIEMPERYSKFKVIMQSQPLICANEIDCTISSLNVNARYIRTWAQAPRQTCLIVNKLVSSVLGQEQIGMKLKLIAFSHCSLCGALARVNPMSTPCFV